jgi:hypothetical protein
MGQEIEKRKANAFMNLVLDRVLDPAENYTDILLALDDVTVQGLRAKP